MNKENKMLLEEVIGKKLEYALSIGEGSEESNKAFDQLMKAIDRSNEISKNDDTYEDRMKSLELEKLKIENDKLKIEYDKLIRMEQIDNEKFKTKIENEKIYNDNENRIAEIKNEKEVKLAQLQISKWDIIKGIGISILEIAAISIVAPALERKFKLNFAKDCMTWEDTHTFTTTPGRNVKDIFRFK